MAITRLSPDKLPPPFRRRKAGIVDLEWDPDTYQLRLIGVYYQGRYRDFGASLIDFLEWFLQPCNSGLELWAHYGGKADFAFIIPVLRKAKIQCDGIMKGSSVFALTITIGRHRYYLRDSFFVTMCGLDEAGKTFVGRGKTDCDFRAPIAELRDYNENDCLLTYEVLCNLDDEWGELGTRLHLTNAATAFSLIRVKYLTEDIPTNDATNAVFRKHMFCSIVAVFCRSVRTALDATGAPYAVGYDQNSAHPCSYAGPMPGRELTGSRHAPPKRDAHGRELTWMLDADIYVPDDLNIPPLPMKSPLGRIVFPTGRWRGIWAPEQIELLEDCGGRVESAHWYYTFVVNRDLERFAHDMFAVKASSYINGEPTGKTAVSKYAINSGGFGKFAERPQRMQLIIGEIPEKYLYDSDGNPLASAEDIRILAPSLAIIPTFRPAPHEHVPMANVIGARSMTRLIRDMQLYEAHGGLNLYCDTDKFIATLSTDGYEPKQGKGLGEYKCENPRIEDGYFAGPKMYCIKDTAIEQTIIRAKSFPTAKYGELVPNGNGKRRGYTRASDDTRPDSAVMTYEKIGQIIEDWPWEDEPERPNEHTVQVEFDRMKRIPEMLHAHKLRGEALDPGSVHVVKRPKCPAPSRCFDKLGFSRPWSVDELMRGVKQ